MLDWL